MAENNLEKYRQLIVSALRTSQTDLKSLDFEEGEVSTFQFPVSSFQLPVSTFHKSLRLAH